MSASLSAGPSKEPDWKIFVQTQFRTKPRPPPASTSFAGKTAVVTGANSGLGLEFCKLLLELGLSRLVMGVRDVGKASTIAEELRKAHPSATIVVTALDHMSYESVQAFAASLAATPESRLDLAVLNAGVVQPNFVRSAHGHEEMFQVNYLSTALLSLLLLPILDASRIKYGTGPGRLTIVSSNMALQTKFPKQKRVPLFPALDEEEGWDINVAQEQHNITKTFLIALALKLGSAVSPDKVIVNSVDPGLVKGTNLNKQLPLVIRSFLAGLKTVAARTLRQGAWTYLDAVAVKGKESHGSYLMNWDIHPFPSIMYTDDGQKAIDQMWEETLTEFDFANARGLLASIGAAE